MEKWNVFLGVDVSKNTLDVCCASRNLHIRIGNGSSGFARLDKWCREHGIDLKATLFVMEYTGGYEYRFLQYCQEKSYACCRVPGLEIKQSIGMVRGKSDHADSYRIGNYAEEKYRKLKVTKLPDNNILHLRHLLAFRKRLVRENAGYKASIKEREVMYGKTGRDKLVSVSRKKIKANQGYIRELEEEIMAMINGDEAMKFNYGLITSIKGIGQINACMVIAYTGNFTSFTDARKFAVYVGVIPFEHTSGTSVRKPKRVSPLANREVKQELNQAAKAAMAYDAEIRAYAQRKLEKKAYPLVLNNIKFKLILRIFALVKRREKYVENYIGAA